MSQLKKVHLFFKFLMNVTLINLSEASFKLKNNFFFNHKLTNIIAFFFKFNKNEHIKI